MDFLILVLMLGLALHQIYLHLFLRVQLRKLHTLAVANRAKQGRMRKLARSTPEPPPVVDRARTTTRDTDDLPATGRMGQLIPFRGGEHDSFRDDG